MFVKLSQGVDLWPSPGDSSSRSARPAPARPQRRSQRATGGRSAHRGPATPRRTAIESSRRSASFASGSAACSVTSARAASRRSSAIRRTRLSRGRICPRGTGGTGLLYDPDRLKTPLIRARKRGEDIFQEASREMALDRVASELEKIRARYGPEALALFTHGWGGSWFTRLMQVYGSPNVAAPSHAQCRGPREAGFQLTYGQGLGSPESIDIENARCIALLGSRPASATQRSPRMSPWERTAIRSRDGSSTGRT